MSQNQICIRDFGEKIRYLIGKRGTPELPVLSDDYRGRLPQEFPQFDNEKKFATHAGVHQTTLIHWRNDDRHPHDFRLAPKFEEAVRISRIFGIWPKAEQCEDIRAFWSEAWPSWFVGEANEQYEKDYKRCNDSKRGCHADSLAVFQREYCKALISYCEGSEGCPLYFASGDGESRRRAVEDLIRLIHSTPQVLLHLQRQENMKALPIESRHDDESCKDTNISSAVDWLLNAPIDDIIKACYRALSKIDKGEPGRELTSIRAALITFAQRIIPALYNHRVISKIKSVLKKETSGLVVLPAYRPAVAEIAVAAAEVRSIAYFPRKRQDEWPIGTRSFIDQVPDSGFDSREQSLRNLKRELVNLFTASSIDDVGAAFRSFVAGAYFEPEPGTDFNEDFRYRIACDNIKFRMSSENTGFYMTFRYPKEPRERTALNELVETLEKNLQGMLFLALVDDVKIVQDENNRYRPFISMLPVDAVRGQS